MILGLPSSNLWPLCNFLNLQFNLSLFCDLVWDVTNLDTINPIF